MKRKSKDPSLMVCMRADYAFMIAGSEFDLICTRCARPVMTAPSGKQFLASHPRVHVICSQCFDPRGRDRGSKLHGELTAEPEVILRELMTAAPNPRARSN